MELTSAALRKLTCDNCEGYLSCGPVVLLNTGKNRCGRCSMPDEAGQRNLAYETVANLVRFPCHYEENGCTEKVKFQHCRTHEESCAFRQYLCPVAESGKCDWSGVRHEILDHCAHNHPACVVDNPVTLEHNITKPSLGNYVLSAFQVLFLVQTKVCVASRTIYHSVRLIGNGADAARYEYDLSIQNNDSKIGKVREVSPAGCLALQVDSSIAMAINTLLNVLGDFRLTTFTLTVRLKKEQTAAEPSIHVQCANCQSVTEPVYHSKPGWLCRTCGPVIQFCENTEKGCTYMDTEIKCLKHEHFCAHGNWCMMCSQPLKNESPETHYALKHGAVTHAAGDMWTTRSKGQQWYIVMAEFGKALCFMHRHGYKLFLYIRTPLRSEALYKYKCVVTVSHPVSGQEWTWTADRQHFFAWDWELNTPDINNRTFLNEEKMNIRIDFIKINDVTEL